MQPKRLHSQHLNDSSPSQDRSTAHISKRSSKSPPRREPAQERAQVTVEAIVEAAGQLLVERGRKSVTTNEVAKRAGVSIGSVYQYFRDKQAIFDALQQRHRAEVMPLIQHAMARLYDPSLDLVDGIVMLMKGMAELHQANPRRMRALAEELEHPLSSAEILAFTDATVDLLVHRTGQEASKVRATAWLASLTLAQLGHALVHRPPDVPLDPVFDSLTRMLQGLFDET